MNSSPNRRCQAFTLIEMLVVIAVIALLASLTVPAVRKSIVRAQQAQSMNNLRQLVAANLNYAVDHGHYAPAADRWNTTRWHGKRTSATAPFDPALGYLAPYLGEDRRVTRCPRFQSLLRGSDTFEEGTGGYGYNSAYIGGWPGTGYDKQGRKIPARPSYITHTRTVMFASSAYARSGGLQEYAYTEPPFWDFGSGPTQNRPSPTTHFRFNGIAIIGWMDGSVSTVKPDPRTPGTNPHGGNADALNLGWFGPDDQNGFWNPARTAP